MARVARAVTITYSHVVQFLSMVSSLIHRPEAAGVMGLRAAILNSPNSIFGDTIKGFPSEPVVDIDDISPCPIVLFD